MKEEMRQAIGVRCTLSVQFISFNPQNQKKKKSSLNESLSANIPNHIIIRKYFHCNK